MKLLPLAEKEFKIFSAPNLDRTSEVPQELNIYILNQNPSNDKILALLKGESLFVNIIQ